MKSARIEFSGRTIACMVRNQSETGAALEVESPWGIPAQFTLSITEDKKHRCAVIWRAINLIGVKFR
ncbi:PilZ domain-containing protein [Bradyrhizobium sp. CB3481]|uniref:PilZ domain-containing protein n=1 Tax=Bradyrhizobium sp. CB3481 TaxID=3039158 RepID=UPI0024B0745C|nr:PilZ domain-containing protein [Bradyrhizobium sp. CB3481]WFU18873.1 PilZ domain-containing protein [Bradyrhizobium sp. CB3481]